MRQSRGGLRQSGGGLRLSMGGVRYGGELKQDEVGLKLKGAELKLVEGLTVLMQCDGGVRQGGGLRLGGDGVKHGAEKLRIGGARQDTGGTAQ